MPFDTGYLPNRPPSSDHAKPFSRVNHKNAYGHRSNDSFGNQDKSVRNKYCGACKKKGHWLLECPDYKLIKVNPDNSNESKGRPDEEKVNKSQWNQAVQGSDAVEVNSVFAKQVKPIVIHSEWTVSDSDNIK